MIVVTGIPIETLKSEHDGCVVARCATVEDIGKSLAYAEGLFVAGDYRDARRVLAKAIGRNRGAAAQEPVLVSQLYRASGRISAHLGYGDRYRMDTHRIVQTLKEGAQRDEAELLLAELEVAEMSLKMGNRQLAERTLAMVEERAMAADFQNIAAIASLRKALVPYLGFGRKDWSVRRLKALARREGDEYTAGVRVSAKLLIAQLSARSNTAPDVSRLLDDETNLPPRQVLVWSPPFVAGKTPMVRNELGSVSVPQVNNVNDRWADVGFRVLPDGKVDDVTVLRRNGPGDWLDRSVEQVEGRVYTPLPATAADDGVDGDYRVERHTFIAFYGPVKGSRIEARNGQPRVEIVDLTLR
ncbi:hypothetical protein FHS79_000088 [Polymorphobacter multimanifer]|uniref:Uncharacterized protein n=1 Tax=Polymorphobacter multimanifer TaxID=1070431 RepID=A0A841KZU1_9SPHN|nr:hypothetical protein [Polymorphobacter multimanifer]MBB6225937.1 hypothetical protein [Polymorphobacter multimanifer]